MAENLNTDLAIVYKDPDTGAFLPTSYFEDYLFNIIEEFGGEGVKLPSDSFDLSSYPPDLATVSAQLKSLIHKVDDIEKSTILPLNVQFPDDTTDIAYALSAIKDIRAQLNAIEHSLEPIGLAGVFQRLNDLEKQV